MGNGKSIQRLVGKRKELLREMSSLTDIVNGSITKMYRRCYKPGCICEKGEKHGPAWALLYKEEKKTKMVYLPEGSMAECQRRLKQYGRFKEVARKMIDINRQIMKLQFQAKKKKRQTKLGKEE